MTKNEIIKEIKKTLNDKNYEAFVFSALSVKKSDKPQFISKYFEGDYIGLSGLIQSLQYELNYIRSKGKNNDKE